jgi:tetratricopeptide (TPR) repeat protein
MRLATWLLTVFLATTAHAATDSSAPAGEHPPLSSSDILKRMNASHVLYSVKEAKEAHVAAEDFATLLWPPAPPPHERPWIGTDAQGRRTLGIYEPPKAVREEMKVAERLFEKNNLESAALVYEEVLKTAPDCYVAHLYLGDCALALHDPGRALRHYEQAVALNPNDYQAHFFRGDALFKLGRPRDAIEAYTEALVDRPNHRLLIESLLERARELGVTVHDDGLAPGGMARRGHKSIDVITADAEPNAAWLAYASCKALWLGEPSHRREMGVKDAVAWSSAEERECLVNLAAVYAAGREKQTQPREEALDRLVQATRSGLLDAFVIYEIGARMEPQITLTLNDAARARIREYVSRFVIVPWENENASATK